MQVWREGFQALLNNIISKLWKAGSSAGSSAGIHRAFERPDPISGDLRIPAKEIM